VVFLANSIDNIFGKRIKELRLKKGLTIERLAELIGISPTYLGLVEKGNKSLRIENFKRLSDVLDVSIDYMVKESFQKNTRVDIFSLLLNDLDDKDFLKVYNVVKVLVEQLKY